MGRKATDLEKDGRVALYEAIRPFSFHGAAIAFRTRMFFHAGYFEKQPYTKKGFCINILESKILNHWATGGNAMKGQILKFCV